MLIHCGTYSRLIPGRLVPEGQRALIALKVYTFCRINAFTITSSGSTDNELSENTERCLASCDLSAEGIDNNCELTVATTWLVTVLTNTNLGPIFGTQIQSYFLYLCSPSDKV